MKKQFFLLLLFTIKISCICNPGYFGPSCEIYVGEIPKMRAFYPFNSNTNDYGPYKMNGTNHGADITGVNRFGDINSSFIFNSEDQDYVDLGDYDELQPSNMREASISVWFKTTSLLNQVIIREGTDGYVLWMGNSTIEFKWSFIDAKGADGIPRNFSNLILNSEELYNQLVYNDNQWHHIVATYEYDHELKRCLGFLFFDGIWVGYDQVVPKDSHAQDVGEIYYSHGGITIGRNGSFNNYYFNGSIDDVIIYDRYLRGYHICVLYLAKNHHDVCNSRGTCLYSDHCQCENLYSGITCEECSLPCNTGLCINTKGTNNCSCSNGIFGNNCEYCDVSVFCNSLADSCSSIGGVINCSCSNGFFGNNCEYCDVNVFCNSHADNCSSIGLHCECNPAGYVGDSCDIFVGETNGILALYLFNSNANDYGPNKINGINLGAKITGVDRFGKENSSFVFYSPYYVDLGDSLQLWPVNSISISCWFKTKSLLKQVIIRKGGYGYILWMENLNIELLVYYNDAAHAFFINSDQLLYDDNQWHHIVAMYDVSNGGKLYFDGILVDSIISVNRTIYYSSGGIAIGRNGPFNDYYFNGSIDDVIIYDRYLREDEICLLYSAKPHHDINICNSDCSKLYDNENTMFSVSFYIENLEECVYVIYKQLDWFEAEKFCRLNVHMNSHLVSITSLQKSQFLKNILRKNTTFWIGGVKINGVNSVKDNWFWTNGDKFKDFMNWEDGVDSGKDDFISLDTSSFKWSSKSYQNEHFFICTIPGDVTNVNLWNNVYFSNETLHNVNCDIEKENCPEELSMCNDIKFNNSLVCTGHGECIRFEECKCDNFYYSTFCDDWNCTLSKNSDIVCNENGNCLSSNNCECFEGFYDFVDFCDGFDCFDTNFNSSFVCSGMGTCISPDKCSCNKGYEGINCKTNENVGLYIGLGVGLSSSVIFVIIVFVIFVTVYYCRVRKKVKRFSEIDDVSIIIKEQKMMRNSITNVPKMKISSKKINHSDISIISILGEGGGKAIVYKFKGNSCIVAYKRFRIDDFSEIRFKNFEKEVNIFASLNHPFILKFMGCTTKMPYIGIVMEFAENGDVECFISNYVKNNHISYPIKEKFRMIHQISSALVHIHERKIIHRDLKPQNTLISKNEEVRLCDFGISRIFLTAEETKTKRIGTGHYISPEVTRSGHYDEKCDVFSFSIMIFEIMFENFVAFTDETENNIPTEIRIMNDPNFRPIFPDIKTSKIKYPLWFQNLCELCWSDKSTERYSFKEIVEIIEEKMKEIEDNAFVIFTKTSNESEDCIDVEIYDKSIEGIKQACFKELGIVAVEMKVELDNDEYKILDENNVIQLEHEDIVVIKARV